MSGTQLYTFSLQQVKVASWLGGGGYGTPYVLQSSKTLSVSQEMISDRSMGNSYITDLETQLISLSLQLDTAGFDPSALTVFTGIATSISGADTVQPINNKLLPYFGMIAQVFPNAGDVLYFFPYCKITKSWTYKLEFGKIIVPQFACEAIQDPTLGYMMQPYIRPTATSSTPITFPPTT